MPLLFSILEHYNPLSKQPNCACGLFIFDLMFMANTCFWCFAPCPGPEQSWAFLNRLGLFQRGLITIYYISKNESPKTVRRRKGHTGPPERPRGEELPCRFLSRPSGSQGDILGPQGSPTWGRAALQVSLWTGDLVTVWAHPGGSWHSAFSKTSLNIWKFTVHVFLKPGLEKLKHYFTSMWDECN